MNAAQQMLSRGASILAKQSGQADRVTLRGKTVDANVLRNQESLQTGDRKEDSTEEKSVIEYPLGGLIPACQDILTDSLGFKHEVKRVRHIGHALRLDCEVVR